MNSFWSFPFLLKILKKLIKEGRVIATNLKTHSEQKIIKQFFTTYKYYCKYKYDVI